MVGGAKTTVTTSLEVGANQNWSKSKSYDVSATAEMTPNKPGMYKLSGWVNIAENIELNFRAKALFTATGKVFNR